MGEEPAPASCENCAIGVAACQPGAGPGHMVTASQGVAASHLLRSHA